MAKAKQKKAARKKVKVVSLTAALAKVDHTKRAYLGLSDAYTHFNRHLFKGALPTCLITMQRKKNMRGYFWKGKFQNGATTTDELALNPAEYEGRTPEEVLSTLVHEMVHVWQHHFGTPTNGYHNAEWAAKMKEVGLYPSKTGKPNGKETGQQVTHYILKDGRFTSVCKLFLKQGTLVLYKDAFGEGKHAKAKTASKTKYTCNECGINAWAKPDTYLMCGECDCTMIAPDVLAVKKMIEVVKKHKPNHNYRKAA